jgi:hypothetical protein
LPQLIHSVLDRLHENKVSHTQVLQIVYPKYTFQESDRTIDVTGR